MIAPEKHDDPASLKRFNDELVKTVEDQQKTITQLREELNLYRREIIEADVSPEERMCSCCGDEMPIIGTDVTERLDLIPAELFVLAIHRHKRACGKCKESIAQVPAGQEPGGLVSSDAMQF